MKSLNLTDKLKFPILNSMLVLILIIPDPGFAGEITRTTTVNGQVTYIGIDGGSGRSSVFASDVPVIAEGMLIYAS